jgi:hypothetical protein
MRSGVEVRDAFEVELLRVIERVANGLAQPSGAERRARAWSLMAMLSGAVTITRSLSDETLAAKVASDIRRSATLIATN